MKKILFLSLVLVLLLTLFCLPSHAQAADASLSESVSEARGAEMADPPSETEGTTITAAIADFFKDNADTILGVLTLLGSLLVAFFYKLGLLPMLRSGLTALRDLLGKSRDMTEAFTQSAGETFSRIEEQTAPVLCAIKESEGILHALEERLGALERALAESEKDRRDTALVLQTETELFYELLNSVNLPEAQKESMTESYYRLKQKLEAGA